MFGGITSSAEGSVPTTTAAPANPFAGLASASKSTPTSSFTFGSTQPASTPAKESTPTTKSLFGSTQSIPATTQESTPVSKPVNFGASLTPAPAASSADTSSATPFSLFGKTQGDKISTPAASTGLFSNFGSASQSASTGSATPTPSFFGAKTQDEGSNASAASKNLFAGFGGTSQGETASTPSASPSLFGAAPKDQTNDATAAASVATPAATTTQSDSTTAVASAPSLFKSFGPTSTAPVASGGATTNLFSASTPGNAFGGFKPAISTEQSTTPTHQNTVEKPSLFSFSTPKATANTSNDTPKEQESPTPATGFGKSTFATNTSGSSSGSGTSLFSQSLQPQKPDSNPFSFQQPKASNTTSLFSQSQPAKNNNSQQEPSPTPFSLFNKQPSSDATKETSQDPAQSAPEQNVNMPALTGSAAPPLETSETSEPIRIPTMYLPENWGSTAGSDTTLEGLAVKIVSLNGQYLEKLNRIKLLSDWTRISEWHANTSREIVKKIKALKKQAAAEKGITGQESSLSVKRKATSEDDSFDQTQNATPFKKPRASDNPSTPTPQAPTLPTTTPKASPHVSNTSSLFGSVLSKSSSSADANVEKNTGPPKAVNTQPGFSFLSNGSKPAASQSPFQMPSSGSAGKTSIFGSGGGLLSQFSSKAKSYEQLVAERKAKEKEEDYDSDEESEEQWSARWDKKEAERVAKEKETSAPTAPVPVAPQSSNSGLNLLSGFGKSTSNASTPGLFGSRVGSPALSTGGQSVFDTPETAQSPASNPFAHLSSGPSSNNHDDDDDEDAQEAEGAASQPTPEQSLFGQSQTRKRKVFDDTESESGESTEDTHKRNKTDDIQKPSLADRITKASSEAQVDESEKENGDPNKASSQTNGFQTPAKPFGFFDFGKAAGAQSAPPKQDKFVGDQTFKAGTPIKFQSAVKGTPTFQFQPTTPSAGEFSTTPSKPPPASTFSFLNAGASSTPGSVFSSRAPTPLSETENSGKESAVDNEDDEGEKHAQVDLSELTEEEKAANDILFHTEPAICKHQVDKAWENYARGRMWILRNKETGKAFVRMRLSSGNTMLNYNILPKLKTNISGSSKKMVSAIGTKKDGKTGNIVFAVKSPEIAAELSKVYNDNLPA